MARTVINKQAANNYIPPVWGCRAASTWLTAAQDATVAAPPVTTGDLGRFAAAFGEWSAWT